MAIEPYGFTVATLLPCSLKLLNSLYPCVPYGRALLGREFRQESIKVGGNG